MATTDGGRRAPRAEPPAAQRAAGRSSAPLLAYVLHRYDWSETSLIVDLYTRSLGRVVVVAKGAKRPTSQLRPVLLPFQPLHAMLGKVPKDENAEVRLLRSAEWVGGRPLLAAPAMFSGFYLNELLLKLLARQDPHPGLFDAYADSIAALAVVADEGPVLRAFELVLLRELGWLPELDSATLTAQPLQPEALYTLHPESGIVPAADGLAGTAWVAMEAALVHGGSGGGMAALRAACAPAANTLRGLLRTLLHYHLGATPLRTRQVMQGLQRLAET